MNFAVNCLTWNCCQDTPQVAQILMGQDETAYAAQKKGMQVYVEVVCIMTDVCCKYCPTLTKKKKKRLFHASDLHYCSLFCFNGSAT